MRSDFTVSAWSGTCLIVYEPCLSETREADIREQQAGSCRIFRDVLSLMGGQILRFAPKLCRSAWVSLALFSAAVPVLAQLPANVYVNSRQFNFAYQTGGATSPQPQTLQVIAEPARNFTATATLQDPLGVPNWLTVNGGSSTTGTTGQATSFVTVAAVPTGLPAGVYRANIRVVLADLPQATTDITVFLRVSASPQVSLNVPLVNLQGQTGTQISTPLVVNSTAAAIPYTAAVSQYYGATGWLSIVPGSPNTAPAGNTGPNANLVANLAGLPSGLYFAVVNFHSESADPGDVSLPVVLTVTQTTTVSVNPARLDFAFQASNLSASPNTKALSVVGSGGAAIPYTATISGDSRISISKTSSGGGAGIVQGTTPESVYVIVNPAGIPAGTSVEATVTISTLQNSVTVPVRATVTNAPLILPAPDAVTFNYTLGGVPPGAVAISVTGTQTLGFSVSEAEVTGGDWLTVATSQSQTPGFINVSLNAARLIQLAGGTYTANITIASPSAGNNPVTVPVTLTVTGSSVLTVNPTALDFVGELNGRVPDRKTFVVSSTDGSNQPFTVSVEPASPWLIVDKTTSATGTLGDIITVTVDPTRVTEAGKYEADILVTPQSTTPGVVGQRVHVTFTVTSSTSVTATPASITATQVGATPPAPVTVAIASPVPGVNFTARAEAPWFTVSPVQGTTNQNLTVTFASAELQPGVYDSSITILPPGANALTIPVKLTVASAAQLNVSPAALTVNYTQGTPAPAAQTIALTSSGAVINFTAAATSTGNWLAVTPASGATGASGAPATNLSVAVTPTGLTPGTYTGTVTITAANASNSPQTITVTLTVSAQAAAVIRSIENAARNETTLAAPGLIIAIKGSNLGPATGVSGTITNGVYDTTLSEARVLFDGIPAPMLYARQDQINTVAPYSLFGRTSTRVQVEYRGLRSDPIEYRVVDTAPGIFTQDSTGRGAGSILNQNNSVNTANNPARRGEIIAIYATGEGNVRPAGSDGRVTTGPVESIPRPTAPVSVRINGVQVPAENITYAGSAPGIVAGGLQVNVRIPADLNITAATQAPIEIQVGSAASQSGVTVAIIP